MAFEEDLVKLLGEAGADPEDVETLHYKEEKSRNPEAFAEALVGLLYGCIDPRDEHVLDLLAECDLEARPERAEPDDGRQDSTSAF